MAVDVEAPRVQVRSTVALFSPLAVGAHGVDAVAASCDTKSVKVSHSDLIDLSLVKLVQTKDLFTTFLTVCISNTQRTIDIGPSYLKIVNFPSFRLICFLKFDLNKKLHLLKFTPQLVIFNLDLSIYRLLAFGRFYLKSDFGFEAHESGQGLPHTLALKKATNLFMLKLQVRRIKLNNFLN